MELEEQKGGGLAKGDFTPSPEFIDSFKNTPVEGADFHENPPPPPPPGGDGKTPEQIEAERLAAEKGTGGNDGKSEEDKKAELETARLAEEEKMSKMSPEEKTAYLESKNPPPPPPPAVKSFEDEFTERFGGKKFEEVKAALEAEKEEVFANDQIKFFNELAKSGVKIDANYIATITKNYEGMDSALEILAEEMRQNNPGMEEDEIQFEIESKYKMKEWAAEGEEPTEIEVIMAKKQLREANEAREKLIAKRNSLSFIKPKDEVAEAQAVKDRLASQQKFETTIDTEIVPKVPTLSTKFTDEKGVEQTLDFQIDDSARGKVVPLMKTMGSNVDAFFYQFNDNAGKFDHVKFYQYQLKAENYDKAAKLFYEKGKASGELAVVKEIKNTDFDKNGKQAGGAPPMTMEQAMADSLSKNM